jgi:DNA-directed RNA polymerase subunit RPC12/RpoP
MPTEKVLFRLFVMPCCQHNLCWVNPRLPTFCPECGDRVYMKLRTDGTHTMVNDPNAILKTKSIDT